MYQCVRKSVKIILSVFRLQEYTPIICRYYKSSPSPLSLSLSLPPSAIAAAWNRVAEDEKAENRAQRSEKKKKKKKKKKTYPCLFSSSQILSTLLCIFPGVPIDGLEFPSLGDGSLLLRCRTGSRFFRQVLVDTSFSLNVSPFSSPLPFRSEPMEAPVLSVLVFSSRHLCRIILIRAEEGGFLFSS